MISKQEALLLGKLDKDELVRLTQDLVRIDSVIRPETGNTEKEVVRYIVDWLERELDLKALVEEVEPDRENIIVTIDSDRPGPCLLLEGHTDVVSEGELDRWSVDPFGAEIKTGNIYGRGSCDMKAGLAINLLTAKALLRSGSPFKGKLRLGIVCDEEAMMIGIKDFIKRGHADDVDAALSSEPEGNHLCISMKGALRALVKVQGKMAHGCMPLTGINPNTRLARIILAFEAYEKEEIERCGSYEFLGYPSITFTVIQAPPAGVPAQLNVMPAEARGFVDIRTTPCQDHEIIRTRLQTLLEDLAGEDPDFQAQIEFIEDRPVVTTDRNEAIVQTAAQAHRDITGREPVYNGAPGTTDGTYLRAWKNIPVLVNGPGPRHAPHQADEYVQIEELYEAAQISVLTTYRFLNQETK